MPCHDTDKRWQWSIHKPKNVEDCGNLQKLEEARKDSPSNILGTMALLHNWLHNFGLGFCLKNREGILFCCFKSPHLWHFGKATLGNQYTIVTSVPRMVPGTADAPEEWGNSHLMEPPLYPLKTTHPNFRVPKALGFLQGGVNSLATKLHLDRHDALTGHISLDVNIYSLLQPYSPIGLWYPSPSPTPRHDLLQMLYT